MGKQCPFDGILGIQAEFGRIRADRDRGRTRVADHGLPQTIEQIDDTEVVHREYERTVRHGPAQAGSQHEPFDASSTEFE
ncbi:MAG: hypothetical protein JRG86_22850 [Deltaproteobacteria bacterium]|nr:hypothetical protein [Deltaproteobacteria bacterium]MBW2497350.1 hypothetical protein [Deltaproteobacteria bacterium]